MDPVPIPKPTLFDRGIQKGRLPSRPFYFSVSMYAMIARACATDT